ncbi:9198_t:CDS:2 [Diversispora eburnea]|uniref:9198_t:CDS:1 n=1 Tax=Diversispora eburnea TaxID=1213867 RepID=A0A9N8VAZ4_9GLOM|nr:9198_t:CDS:2 [Diversispora eburnea]
MSNSDNENIAWNFGSERNNGPLNQREPLDLDPLKCILDGAQKLVFLPADWLHIICTFLTHIYALRVSENITFKEILQNVQMNYGIVINPNRITYENQVNDMITLIDEEDWRSAVWEAKRAKNFMIRMFFS